MRRPASGPLYRRLRPRIPCAPVTEDPRRGLAIHRHLPALAAGTLTIALLPGAALWAVTSGDPGATADLLFADAVYYRGAMILHALRRAVGDDRMRRIVRGRTEEFAGQAATTDDFIALAEDESGLDELFQTWLCTPGRPATLG